MNSLKAFLSPCKVITTESDLHEGILGILIEDGQPAQMFDHAGQPQPFQVVSIANPESLTREDIDTLVAVAQQTKWIVIVGNSGQVHGILEPQSNKELLIASRTTIQRGEFGSATAPPLPSVLEKMTTQSLIPSATGCYSLQEWWDQIVKGHECYQCYAFFLCLPSDSNAIEYITKFGKELDVLAGENCLIIVLSKAGCRRSRYDKAIWNFAINEHIREGYSIAVANLFRIKYIDLPCIVLFKTLHSPKRVVFSFKGLEVDGIGRQMREIFTVVQQSITNRKDPILALEHYQGTERLNKVGSGIFGRLFGFAEKTFATAMEAWIKASLK